MMKVRRLSRIILLSMLMVFFFGMTSDAALKETKEDTWYSFDPKTFQGEPQFKIVVPAKSYITFTLVPGAHLDIAGVKKIGTRNGRKIYYGDQVSNLSDDTVSKLILLPKGTYKIMAFSMLKDASKAKCFKYKFTAYKETLNYRSSKAVALAANKDQRIIYAFDDSYPRWYKIELTKQQKVTVYKNKNDNLPFMIVSPGIGAIGSFNQFESSLKKYDIRYVTRDKLPAGVYYIVFGFDPGMIGGSIWARNDHEYRAYGIISYVKWK